MEPHRVVSDETAAAHRRAVLRVIDLMRSRLDEEWSLEDLAKVAFMSPFHFSRTFRHVTGIPPRHYLSAVRLQAARRMLVNSGASVTDVCLDVGYSSLGTFVRRFTALLGVPPTRFRAVASASGRALIHRYAAQPALPGPAVRGTVAAPAGFDGIVFVALFRHVIPEGAPVACTLSRSAGPYVIDRVPPGTFHLFAVGVPWQSLERDLLLCETVLRAGGHAIAIDEAGATGATELMLREPSPLDPPILVSLTALLAGARRQPDLRRPAAQAG
jgi:AraC-like DNA-binding protein